MSAVFLALSFLLLAVPALAQSTGSGSCTDVHIFLAKGWNEKYDDQRQTELVNAICNDLGSSVSCDYEDIILNNLAGSHYCTAVTGGISAGKQQMQAYVADCPNSKLVLSGYSEGAQVVGDILAGGGGTYDKACKSTAPIDSSSDAVCQLAAVTLFGNSRHVANASYNADSGVAGVGHHPRTPEQADVLAGYASKLRDWCNMNDPVCARGLGSDQTIPFHTDYFDKVTDDAASWVVSKINAASSCGQTSGPSSGPSSSSTTSASASTATSTARTSADHSTDVSSTETTMTSSSAGLSALAGHGDAFSTATTGPIPSLTPDPSTTADPVSNSSIGRDNGTAIVNGAMDSTAAAPSDNGSEATTSALPSPSGAAGNVKLAGGPLAAAVGVAGLLIA